MVIQRHTMHAIYDTDTPITALNSLFDYVKEMDMCGIKIPYDEGKLSICFRHSGHSGKCGGYLYRAIKNIGLEKSL